MLNIIRFIRRFKSMQVKVMTFNIRYDTPTDGENSFSNRKDFIKEFIDAQKPDVIGFQEVLPHVRKWLCDNLCDYTILGMGRDKDYSGESVSIAYRKEKYDLVKFDQFWLSDTPDVPGSRFGLDQSVCPRISVQATLVSRADGRLFTFANTHLDHVGEYARVCGASVVMSKLISQNSRIPFLLTGDFNEHPDGNSIKEIKSISGVHELTSGIKASEATYHNYGNITKNSKIDYIFSSGKAVKDTLIVHKDTKGKLYLSDHYPISVVAEL